MTEHHLGGLRTTPLASYLATLGLARLVAEQADPELRLWWTDSVPVLDSVITDLPQWLTTSYAPTPILSPWNEGSGFGAKDKTPRQVLTALLASADPRLDGFRAAYEVCSDVGSRARAAGWDKSRTVRELRNRCPEALLDWIDASVVLAGTEARFPPLLGTGGNDGRLDFSTNFHQRLVEIFASGDAAHQRSRTWATDVLDGGARSALSKAAVGQFDPVGGGGRNTSVFGAADSLVNPWAFVLLVEGSLLFASGVSRRLGLAGRAAMPFTVSSSRDERGAGAIGEESRGEVWAPVWHQPMGWPEVRQLFREARASWRGKSASRSVQMFQATRSLGVARGVDEFTRFGLYRRNGLAFVAVPIEPVDVAERSEVHLAAPLEDWLDRVRRHTKSGPVSLALRHADNAHLAFAREASAPRLVDLLASVTSLEQAVGRSTSTVEALGRTRVVPSAVEYLPVVASDGRPEVRIAASVAAAMCRDPRVPNRLRSLRELLLPIEPDSRGATQWSVAAVAGLGSRPLVDVLADVLVWRARHWDGNEDSVGLVPFPGRRVSAPWGDLHRWVRGELDDDVVEHHLLAFLALDWRRAQWSVADGASETDAVPDPLLALLQAYASGRLTGGDGSAQAVVGLRPHWLVQLRAGKQPNVAADAVALIRRLGWRAAPPHAPAAAASGSRLLAALVARPSNALAGLRLVATPAIDQANEMPTSIVNPDDDPEEGAA